MTDPTHLSRALRGLAENAPPMPIDVDDVRGRIRRRRRIRHATVGGASVAAAATIGTVGALALRSDVPSDVPVASPSAPAPQQAFTFGGCGEPVTLDGPAPESPLEMTVDIDTDVENTATSPFIEIGTMSVTNTGPDTVNGSPGVPRVTLTRDGRVVAPPGPDLILQVLLTLEPGAAMAGPTPVDAALRSCDPRPDEPTGDPGPAADDAQLPPGPYQVFVSWDMSVEGSGRLRHFAGPFDIEIH